MLWWRMSRDGLVTSEGRAHPPWVFILQEGKTLLGCTLHSRLYRLQTATAIRGATTVSVCVYTNIKKYRLQYNGGVFTVSRITLQNTYTQEPVTLSNVMIASYWSSTKSSILMTTD